MILYPGAKCEFCLVMVSKNKSANKTVKIVIKHYIGTNLLWRQRQLFHSVIQSPKWFFLKTELKKKLSSICFSKQRHLIGSAEISQQELSELLKLANLIGKRLVRLFFDFLENKAKTFINCFPIVDIRGTLLQIV